MTIRAKILCLLAAFAALAAAITLLSLSTMADYNRAIEAYRQASRDAFLGERLNRYMTAAALDGRGIYMAQSDGEARAAADEVDVRANALAAFVNDWKAHLTPGELPGFDAARAYVLDMARDGHTLAAITRSQGRAAAIAYGYHPQYRVSREHMQNQIDIMVSQIEARQTASQAALNRFESERGAQFLLIAGSGLVFLIFGSLWVAVRSIAAPLTRVRQAMIRISEGDYTTPTPDNKAFGEEISELWHALDILKSRAIEAERLSRDQRALMLD